MLDSSGLELEEGVAVEEAALEGELLRLEVVARRVSARLRI